MTLEENETWVFLHSSETGCVPDILCFCGDWCVQADMDLSPLLHVVSPVPQDQSMALVQVSVQPDDVSISV